MYLAPERLRYNLQFFSSRSAPQRGLLEGRIGTSRHEAKVQICGLGSELLRIFVTRKSRANVCTRRARAEASRAGARKWPQLAGRGGARGHSSASSALALGSAKGALAKNASVWAASGEKTSAPQASGLGATAEYHQRKLRSILLGARGKPPARQPRGELVEMPRRATYE